MKKILTVRNILAVLGALVIGALGSGLWDVVFKPTFVWIGTVLLNVATLGIQSLVDNIYVEVAKGSYERAADAAYQIIIVIFGGGLIAVPFLALVALKTIDKERLETGHGSAEDRKRRLRMIVLTSLVFESLGAGILAVNTARLSYIIQASNYLEQCERVVAPAIPLDQRLLIASAVAQIRSKDDFLKIVDRLHTIAKSNNLNLPEFSVF